MNKPHSAVISPGGCLSGKTVGGVVNTPNSDQTKPSVSAVQLSERHELISQEVQEGFTLGVTEQTVLHFP